MKTCRRQLIDDFLTNSESYFRGIVLDIGGKKSDKRGEFRPPLNKVDQWTYLNIDSTTLPDILASADSIPFLDKSVDTFIMSEVIEHLVEPEKCLAEAARILKPNGHGIITIPFLYPIHADPWDFQRWTDARISREISHAGLELIEFYPMGGLIAVVIDLIQIRINEYPKSSILLKKCGFALLKIIKFIVAGRIRKSNPRINTGFSLIVRRPEID